ncbi:MAG: Type 1 glutamine amidotransferase-like domain-containing protein [Clostridia bacterium]|nr:Type 1 glutamine amidotransferase-like domain-containing protein [Clostridia bacterium]MBN2882080.1 Type 1 glutamine amidotransferase-like domain-containing protein [Clostridia bacterium]
MKLFLTSAGFDNRLLVDEFFKLTDKTGKSLKALFIPTALNTPEMREAIPVFMEDLYCLGITDENITVYDLEESFLGEISDFDVMLFTAGNPDFLMERINSVGFKKSIDEFLEKDGIYIGISAGSDIVAANIKNGLGYINTIIECHAKNGKPAGILNIEAIDKVLLTDNQALVINGYHSEVIG